MSVEAIELHTMVPAWDLPTFTPFGLKLIAYLQMAAIPYRIVIEHNPNRGPTKKFPWIVDGEHAIGDSSAIIRHLVATRGDTVDGWMNARERAQAHAVRRMVEEGLCFVLLHLRWVDDDTFRAATDVALSGMPASLRRLARGLIRRRILRDLQGQGVLRLPPTEVLRIGRADLDALDALVADKPYLMGDRPCSADANLAGFLAVLLLVPLDNELKCHAAGLERLGAYTRRMAAEYF